MFITLIFFNAFLHEIYINIWFFKNGIIGTDYFETDPETHGYISSEKCCFCVAKGNSLKDDRVSTEIYCNIHLANRVNARDFFSQSTKRAYWHCHDFLYDGLSVNASKNRGDNWLDPARYSSCNLVIGEQKVGH